MAYDRAGKKQTWQPRPRAKTELTKPRRVRSGVKLTLTDEQLAESWAASRWRRLIEQVAEGDPLLDGLEYAKLGQVRSVEIEPGSYHGFVQGRADRPYRTTISLSRLDEQQWEAVLNAMSDQAVYAAKLLAGELPTNIEDLFVPLGVRLFPAETSEITVDCSCKEAKEPWCKHQVCLAQILAQNLANDPFLIFTMRGLLGSELIERLRQRRSLSGVVGLAPVFVQRPTEVAELPTTALDELMDSYWELDEGVERLETPIEPPEVAKPLLRRLGPSPFAESRFPMVGLLATCYEVISGAILRSEELDDEPLQLDAGRPEADESASDPREPEQPEPAQPESSGPPPMPKAKAAKPGGPPPMPKARKATKKTD